jgi:hypothetical protein
VTRAELFMHAFSEWLEVNGVEFTEPFDVAPFAARVDLNALKIGIAQLVESSGGELRE